MPTKRYSTEQIVSKLRQAEVELSRGLRVPWSVRNWGLASRPTTGGGKSTVACASTRPSGSRSSSGRTRGSSSWGRTKPSTALTPLYVKTLLQAAWMIS